MSTIQTTDVIAYAAANRPENNTDTVGGAIDTKIRVLFDNLTHPAFISVVSDSASDTQGCYLEGRDSNGKYIYGTADLAGTDPVTFFEEQYAFILVIRLASDAIGNITISTYEDPTQVVGVIPPGERGFTALFIRSAGDPLAEQVYYDKFFWKNTSADTLRGVILREVQDDVAAIQHAPATAKDDSATIANRLTSPSVSFSNNARNIPGDSLTSGEAIGVWVKKTIPAGEAGYQTYYAFNLSGLVDVWKGGLYTTLPSLTASGTAVAETAAIATATLPSLTASAVAETFAGIAITTLPSLTAAATGTRT